MRPLWGITIALVVIIALLVPYHDQRFDLVVLSGDGWAAEDVRRPQPVHGVLVSTEPIPHRYVLIRDAYTLDALVNPANHSYPAILQIEARAREDESRLSLDGSWGGRCSWLGKAVNRRGWKDFFADPDALGFQWAPAIHCDVEVSEDEVIAKEALGQPLNLVVRDGSGVVLGREVINFEIRLNGWRLYYLLP